MIIVLYLIQRYLEEVWTDHIEEFLRLPEFTISLRQEVCVVVLQGPKDDVLSSNGPGGLQLVTGDLAQQAAVPACMYHHPKLMHEHIDM